MGPVTVSRSGGHLNSSAQGRGKGIERIREKERRVTSQLCVNSEVLHALNLVLVRKKKKKRKKNTGFSCTEGFQTRTSPVFFFFCFF